MTTDELFRPLELRTVGIRPPTDLPAEPDSDETLHDSLQDWRIRWQQREIDGVGVELRRQSDLLADVKAETPVPNEALGPQRRLKIEVPTPAGGGTRMALGYRWEGMNYDGFGVDTAGHVVINARGGVTASTMSLQANGQILVQSDADSLYLVSKKSAYMASAEGANVVAPKGVVIAGGFGGDVVNPPVTGAEPKAPEKLKDYSSWMGTIGGFYGWTDSAFAAFGLLKSGYEIATSTKAGAFKGALMGNLVNLGNIVNNVAGLVDGVTIHGKGGFTLGTPATGGIYALASLTMGSAFAGLYGLQEVEVAGRNSAKVSTFGDAVLLGKASASVLSRGPVEVASREGQVEVHGRTVHVGVMSPSPEGAQRATLHSRVFANNSIKLQTTKKDDQPPLGIHMDAYHSMHLQAKLETRISSEKQVVVGIDREPKALALCIDKESATAELKAKDALCKLVAEKHASLALGKRGFHVTPGFVGFRNGEGGTVGLTSKCKTLVFKGIEKVRIL